MAKFREVTSYHTWLVKFAAVCMAISAIVMFMNGPAWPFRIASILCLMAGIEEIVITGILDKPYSNVRSLVHVLRGRTKIQ